MSLAHQMHAMMVRTNLEQGWACLEISELAMARAHFTQAIELVDQMIERKSEEPLTAPNEQKLLKV